VPLSQITSLRIVQPTCCKLNASRAGIKSQFFRIVVSPTMSQSTPSSVSVRCTSPKTSVLESLGFAQNFLSSCELEALHFIGIGSFGEEFREDVVFRGIQEQFRKPLA